MDTGLEYKAQYKLKVKYPRLPLNFESGDIVYYSAISKGYVRARVPHYAVTVNEVENNPDFWELITEHCCEHIVDGFYLGTTYPKYKTQFREVLKSEIKAPLIITEDGKAIYDTQSIIVSVSSKYEKTIWIISEYLKCEIPEGTKVFHDEDNADMYIEDNKSTLLFTTEDGVAVYDRYEQVFFVDKNFIKDFDSASCQIYDGDKIFKCESNADTFIWKNKPLFSYEEMINKDAYGFGNEEDWASKAKERVKQ